MPQQALVAQPVMEHLGHQSRRHPARAPQFRIVDLDARRRGAAHARCQLRGQRVEQVAAESGSHPSRVAPAVRTVGQRQQQRTQTAATALRRREPDDREFLRCALLHLPPAVPASAVVGRVGALADDAFESPLQCHRQRLVSPPHDMRAVDQAVRRRLQDFRQQRLALVLRAAHQVHAIDLQDVEDHVGKGCVLLAGQGRLQQAEILLPARTGHQFSVQYGVVQCQRAQRRDDVRRACRPFDLVAGPEADVALADLRDQAIAVPLGLVQPGIPFRHVRLQLRQLRSTESRTLAACARTIQAGRALGPPMAGLRDRRHTLACAARGAGRRRA